jgi:quinol monooxygenase YgiN
VKPGLEDAFAAALSEIFAIVRGKDDLLYYFWLVDADDPGNTLVHEAWADATRFEREEADAEYRTTFFKVIDDLLAEDRKVAQWQSRDAFFREAAL